MNNLKHIVIKQQLFKSLVSKSCFYKCLTSSSILQNYTLKLTPTSENKLSQNLVFIRNFSSASQDGNKEHIHKLVSGGNKVVVFIKGTPENPRCGFSNAVVQILKMHGVDKYDSYDVLDNENIRQGVKDFSNWPTIPQVYVNGEFLGGCDLMIEMHQNGDFIKELQKIDIKSLLA